MMLVLVIWMTLMDNHHAIASRTRDCYCLIVNYDRCNLVTNLGNLKT